jgi:ribose-phosphate pyrophosphokinase
LEDSPISRVVVTDTIPAPATKGEKIEIVSVASLLGEAIERIHSNRSVSELFNARLSASL